MASVGKYVKTTADDGTVSEHYYDGADRLHRDDGPAVIERKTDGSLAQTFYRHGQLFRPDVPAPALVEKNTRTGTITNGYARDGRIVRYEILYPRS